MPPLPKLILLPILLLVFSHSSGQAIQARAHEWFDQVVGRQNTGIFNAVEYIEQHRTINDKHKFFLSPNFLAGAVIYEGQPYPGLELKYNVFEDLVIAKVSGEGREAFFQLIKEKVDRFSIAEHLFFNIKGNEYHGFAEILLEKEEMLLLKKHSMTLSKKTDSDFAYYEFRAKNPVYLLQWQGGFFEVDSRRDLIKVFPGLKKEIRQFYSSGRGLRKIDPDAFLKGLLELISNKMTEIQASEV